MKIAVLASGGVDSSVALAMLKQQGYNVTAFYLKIWLEDELSFLGECPWEDDLDYVQKVCAQFDVPLSVVSLQKEYWDRVVSYTIKEVRSGRTPNPDILCNKFIKFGLFLNHIDQSYQKIASGHYAQIIPDPNNAQYVALKESPDVRKDQTYFLSYLLQEQLQRLMFPIGHLRKEQVREYAHMFDLPNKTRKDSQGICFLGKLKFDDFIAHHLGEKVGDFIEYETGYILGAHKGFWFYTIGQRKGTGLAGGPWYVVAKDPENNKVFISRYYKQLESGRKDFCIIKCNWISGHAPEKNRLHVKIRHGATKYNCTITRLNSDRFHVILDQADQGIAPGQFAVLYDESICLGAGIIDIFTQEIRNSD